MLLDIPRTILQTASVKHNPTLSYPVRKSLPKQTRTEPQHSLQLHVNSLEHQIFQFHVFEELKEVTRSVLNTQPGHITPPQEEHQSGFSGLHYAS